jgi:phasin
MRRPTVPNPDPKTTRSPKSNPQLMEKPEAIAAPLVDTAGKVLEHAATEAKEINDTAFAQSASGFPNLVRSLTEQTLDQSRHSFARMKDAAEEASETLEQSFETTRDSIRTVQLKALEAAKANADATFTLMRQLLGASSIADAFQLQSNFARERLEAMVDYSKDVQSTLGKIGAEATRPAKVLMEKAVGFTKAA